MYNMGKCDKIFFASLYVFRKYAIYRVKKRAISSKIGSQ